MCQTYSYIAILENKVLKLLEPTTCGALSLLLSDQFVYAKLHAGQCSVKTLHIS